jgi:hypothetical protein
MNRTTSEYQVIQLPISGPLRRATPSELDKLFDWFEHVLPLRISALAGVVRADKRYSSWSPDCSVASLDSLGSWMVGNVEVQNRSKQDVEEIRRGAPAWFQEVEVPTTQLTGRTFSLCFDTGVYLGEVLRTHNPTLHWVVLKRNKREADYGQPVITGFKRSVVCNPIRLVVTLAYGVAEGQLNGSRLIELYETWASMI